VECGEFVLENDDKTESVRLNRYLSSCGLGARRKCDDLILGGHVLINGIKVKELGTKVYPNDVVEHFGKKLVPFKKLAYIAFHKPRGVMVTKTDPQKRMTIYDALREAGGDFDYLNYVGRLDFNSEGLLLLTNDGDLIHALTHPRYRIKKVYNVKVERKLEESEIKKLIDGVESEGQILHAASVVDISDEIDNRIQHWYEIVLFEGKNRQIRRMLQSMDILISKLRRVQFGSVQLDELKVGEYRHLTEREIGALKSAGYKNAKG
jgi:23S rRNA pseudouridine2605 synthase